MRSAGRRISATWPSGAIAHVACGSQRWTIMKTNASGTSDKIQRLDALLSEHHRSLDRRLNELVTRAEGGDASKLGAAWAALETELVRHMDLEEVELMPAFVEEHPDEARVLLAEHGALRSALNEIGMALQLHCLGTEAVADFARRLRAHSAREDAVLYAWAQAHAPSTTWNAIQRGLKQVTKLGTRFSRVANSYM